jgi:hypothetical protein
MELRACRPTMELEEEREEEKGEGGMGNKAKEERRGDEEGTKARGTSKPPACAFSLPAPTPHQLPLYLRNSTAASIDACVIFLR